VALLSACSAHTSDTVKPGATPAPAPTTNAATPTPASAAEAPTPRNPSPPPPAGNKKWIDLQVGDCLAEMPPTDLSALNVSIVDCASTHQAEVYLRTGLHVDSAIADVANRECAAGLSQYIGRPVEGSPFAVSYLIDSNQDRTGADPSPSTVICLLQSANSQPLTGSAHH
jgi:hypothetical protein